MKRIGLLTLLALFCSCTEEPATSETWKSQLLVAQISPSDGGFIEDSGEILITFDYSVHDDDTSSFGYNIIICLKPADGNGCTSTPNEVFHIKQKEGTLSVAYPITYVKQFVGLAYPLTCTFILERITSDYTNSNIAMTKEYHFKYSR